MRIAIIGAGAAGMMVAAKLAEAGLAASVTLFDGNNGLGKKVLISGGGRCNVTTGNFAVDSMLKNYPRGAKFLKSAMYDFPPEAVYNWFESHGVKLKVEADLRVFPVSNDGHDIVGVFQKIFNAKKLDLRLQHKILAVKKLDGGNFELKYQNMQSQESKSEEFDVVVLATGGRAYRATGSVGDGYEFAEALGHTVTKLGPSLNALVFAPDSVKADWAGVAIKKAKLKLKQGAEQFEFTGAFVFTHRGISGPAVFALSAQAAFLTIDQAHLANLRIDLTSELSFAEFEMALKSSIKINPDKMVANALEIADIPRRIITAVVEALGLNKKAQHLNDKELNRLVEALKYLDFTVSGRAAGDEFVTAGGVDLAEVNKDSLESKICSNLFFAGEILNIDGFTGGYNLQASWATGALVAKNLAKRAKA